MWNNKYQRELPDNDVDYPMHSDSTDMYLQEERNRKDMLELEQRLINQIDEKGITNCGFTSKAQVQRNFSKYH